MNCYDDFLTPIHMRQTDEELSEDYDSFNDWYRERFKNGLDFPYSDTIPAPPEQNSIDSIRDAITRLDNQFQALLTEIRKLNERFELDRERLLPYIED